MLEKKRYEERGEGGVGEKRGGGEGEGGGRQSLRRGA
jgi:hypothetical protein